MRRIVFGAVCVLFLLGAVPVSSQADKPIVLTYSSGYGENFSLSMADRWWAKEVEKRTGGKVKFEFYWSQGLAKIPESLEAVSTGLADISFFAVGYFGGQLPLLTCSSNFYLTSKPDAVSKAMMQMYETSPALKEELEKKNNIRPINFAGTTPLIFGAGKPWTSFDEFKGKKIRTFPGLEKPLAELGAIPVAISWGEIYVSLERGVIDAYTGTMWDLAAIGRFHEKAPYIIDVGVGTYAMAGSFINLDTWNKLPDDVKQVMEEVAAEALAKQPELYMEADKRAYEIYKGSEVKTITFSEEKQEALKNIAVPAQWERWIQDMEAKGLPGENFFEDYKAAIEKFEPDSTYVSPFERFEDLQMK
jgi:TRAP-type C4-dicarboxylate transport system substrate-binding protein